VIRGELRDLDAALKVALPKAADRATRLHLQDARDQIARILDPRFSQAAASAAAQPVRMGLDDPWPADAETC